MVWGGEETETMYKFSSTFKAEYSAQWRDYFQKKLSSRFDIK